MNRLNWLFTLTSLSVVLVTIERFSFTTKILLQPHNFLRLHELVQMSLIILITVVLPFFILREVSQNFEKLKTRSGFLLGLTFLIGVYFYATGNGVHEIASFFFNQYCDSKNFSDNLCGGLFFNDYYLGNILYFIGAFLMVFSILLLEYQAPSSDKSNQLILIINAIVYALAIFAYSAFDRVLVGLIYSIVVTIFVGFLFLKIRKNYLNYPFITYTALTYTLGTVASIIVRVLR